MGAVCSSKGNAKNNNRREYIKSNATLKELNKVYEIDHTCLGEGSFGKVFKATHKSDSSITVAIKVIKKEHMSKDEEISLQNEITLMQSVDHPNIVKYYETYIDKKYFYLCMELMTGGELFTHVLD